MQDLDLSFSEDELAKMIEAFRVLAESIWRLAKELCKVVRKFAEEAGIIIYNTWRPCGIWFRRFKIYQQLLSWHIPEKPAGFISNRWPVRLLPRHSS